MNWWCPFPTNSFTGGGRERVEGWRGGGRGERSGGGGGGGVCACVCVWVREGRGEGRGREEGEGGRGEEGGAAGSCGLPFLFL